jgi:hypothetical protein
MGLWMRSTPYGSYGVGGGGAADPLIFTGYHWLTTGGILGRDILD